MFLYYRIFILSPNLFAKIYKNTEIQKYFGKNLVVSIIFCNFAAEISGFTVILGKI